MAAKHTKDQNEVAVAGTDGVAPAVGAVIVPIPSSSSKQDLVAEPTDVEASISQTRSSWRIALLLMALYLSLFVSALDATIVATAVPVITHELNSATGYIWIGGAYLIANAVACPIWAKVSDIWGRKVVMLTGVMLFFVSSTLCATAKTMSILIAGRTIQGAAGGGLIMLVHIVISDVFSVRERSLYMGLSEGIWATAGGVGPPLGGVFASLVSWRWCFYINLPICGLAFVLLVLFLDVKHDKTSFKIGMKAMDWIGLFCFLAFSLMVLLGLDFGGAIFPWDSAKVICLLVIGICMLGAFVYSQAKLAKYPLIPLAVFKDTSNLAAFGVVAFHGLTFIPGEYYMPLYLQACKGVTPLRSGVLLIPLVSGMAVSGILAGVVIHKTGRYQELMYIGTALLCLGCGLFVMLDASSSLGKIIGCMLVFSIGSGLLFEPPLIALQSRSRQEDVATTTSTFSFVRGVAIAVSIILGGVVFQNSMNYQSDKLAAEGFSASLVEALSGRDAAANVGLSRTTTDVPERDAIRDAFAIGMRNMWIMYVVLAGLGFVASLFVKRSMLSKDHVEIATGIRNEKPAAEAGLEMR